MRFPAYSARRASWSAADMAAPEEMMMAEAAYFQFLPQVQVFKLEGKLLTLTAENGKTMVFEETSAPAEE